MFNLTTGPIYAPRLRGAHYANMTSNPNNHLAHFQPKLLFLLKYLIYREVQEMNHNQTPIEDYLFSQYYPTIIS